MGPAPAPGCDEPTSRCQTTPSIWSSWGLSACYPRRTFYPLSDGPSTRDHRITMTDFRLCSTCQSRSQAGLCHCTLTSRFPTGLSQPSRASVTLWEATAPVKLPATARVPEPVSWPSRLDIRKQYRVVFHLWLHQVLAPWLQSLPPMLHNSFANAKAEAAVKVHGVFPSNRGYSASSRRIQFR